MCNLRSATSAQRGLWRLLAAAAIGVAACGGTTTPAQTPLGTGEPAGSWVRVVARDIAFESAELRVPADEPVTIVFDNLEALPHNLSVDGAPGEGRIFEGEVFSGPATRWYSLPALAPGEHPFLCQVHPSMTGRLVAG